MRHTSRSNYKPVRRKNRAHHANNRPNWLNRVGTILGTSVLTILMIWTLVRLVGPNEYALKNNPVTLSSEELSEQIVQLPEGLNIPDIELEQSEFKEEDWQLILVNDQNPIPSSHSVTLDRLSDEHAIDARCSKELQQMLQDCRAAGLSPYICSSFRTQEMQEQLFEEQKNSFLEKGLPDKRAESEAGKSVALPGTSEHQLGLAVDIVDENNRDLNKSQEKTKAQQWLIKNSWKYGFVLRYPSDKSEITGMIYEPWHYRYVGKAAARDMYDQGECLEEYLGRLREIDSLMFNSALT